jgi:hypothetical protein
MPDARAVEVVADALLLENIGDEEIGWKAAVRLARHAVKALAEAGLLCEPTTTGNVPIGPN